MRRTQSLANPDNEPGDLKTVLTRRDFVSRCVVKGGALLTGITFAGCRAPVAGHKNTPLAEGRRIGTLEFVDEGAALTDTPVGTGLEGRLFTNLSLLTPEKPVIPTERFYIRTRASELIDLRRPWSIQIGARSQLERVPVKDLLRESERQGLHLMECAGNPREGHFGMIGVARWEGVPLRRLLSRIPGWTGKSRVLVSGFDKYRSASSTSIEGCSWIFSAEELAQSAAFLATSMNGKPLTPDHGGPIRLIVPGWYGCACVKWLDKVVLVDDESEATSQMQEFASRTHQNGVPRLARDYEAAVIDPAAMPIRVEDWRVNNRTEYSVVGLAWGGTQPVDGWEIRFGTDEPYVPVERLLPGEKGSWSFWTHTWRPRTPGRYTLRLRLASPTVRTRRLDTGFYARTVEVINV
jgi:DMSO/TMAO reductase YedYZ molybdopterin-dependent catalytic subunit